MKFISKDLAKAMGLNPRDKVMFKNGRIAKVTDDYELDLYPLKASLSVLVDEEYEIVPQKKKVGEKLCKDLDCKLCPLNRLNCAVCGGNSNLYGHLEGWYEKFHDKEIYDILKKRLDKEVEE